MFDDFACDSGYTCLLDPLLDVLSSLLEETVARPLRIESTRQIRNSDIVD